MAARVERLSAAEVQVCRFRFETINRAYDALRPRLNGMAWPIFKRALHGGPVPAGIVRAIRAALRDAA